MKKSYFILVGFLFILNTSAFSQNPIVLDLHDEFKNKKVEVYNRELTLLNEASYKGISLSKAYGEGVAWLKGIEFSNGTIEFDVRGEDLKQHSFVGIAFHGQNDSTFDAVYLRPFQFKAEDTVLRNRSIQYISLPDFTWRKLREKSPYIYEDDIVPTPEPNAWVRMRIVIKDTTVSIYINGNKQPSMVVEKVTSVRAGSIGFYVADTSGGDFANITITKTD